MTLQEIKFNCLIALVVVVCVATDVVETADGGGDVNRSKSVKKDLTVTVKPAPAQQQMDGDGAQRGEVVISERTLKQPAEEVKLVQEVPSAENARPPPPPANQTALVGGAAGAQVVHVEETSFKQKLLVDNSAADFTDSFQTGFFFLVALSCAAVLFITFKVYRLRLSRAERKYGVQGDRTTQELTPLPISLEDGNSDEDDQTLFEINRQQIRIL